MTLFLKKITQTYAKSSLIRYNEPQIYIASRNLSAVPSLYDGDKDPAPKFFSQEVQILLQRLTRPDFAKVFRKRTSNDYPVLRTPKYEFLTSEELEAELAKANSKASKLLQMPPVVKVHKPINEVLSKDPALTGYDTASYLFTDISFGVSNENRLIVQRDPDGTLRHCDHDTRKRLNQVYFPMNGRKLKEPLMFTDEEKFESLLNREKYEFILDRACVQYNPDEPSYQRITSITYQYVDMKLHYETLRSTRHFGSLVFYLTWFNSIDNLLLELIQTNAVREAVLLMAVRQAINGDIAFNTEVQQLTQQILPTPIQLTKTEVLSEEDIQIDTKCVDCIEKYIKNNSAMKNQHELAMQGFREEYQRQIDLSRGLQKAHGNA